MLLKYGNYTHALDEAAIAIQREADRSPRGNIIGHITRFIINGRLHAANQAALTTAINKLIAAYNIPDQDVTLFDDDGTTKSSFFMIAANTDGGIKVVRPPSFPFENLTYTTFVDYTIELEAYFVVNALTVQLLEWTEVLNFSGGGEKWALLGSLRDLPQRQTLQQYTPYYVTQSGRAVGLQSWPIPARPIWPQAWHQDRGGISRTLPERMGAVPYAFDRNWEVAWTYEFESSTPLFGNPSANPL